MMVKPLEALELKAFILGLSQLDATIPENIRMQVNQINIPVDIYKLYDIANSYPPLSASYTKILNCSHAIAKYRSKGLDSIPQFKPEEENTEIDNFVTEYMSELVEFESKVDNNKLIEIARKVLKAVNPVQAAKNVK
ncbi:MAG: hypothetical protein ACFB2X_18250 [Rivularia sp. (in: cyanobacteria)]